ncbi:hypothetical protein Q5V20_004351 [Vibrio parahaemolyticus]|uniref:hypothetical protein n=1 Tax=Vibrio parahaemolyticus TaxID=670 RepID=UPI0015931552|nr:hypothetical protein [Vibrio parahaemolyticus]EHZ2575542.1 hypothetical protein [Vibrio parahaemolyticus]ELA7892626.1 hypothetical protein [Vibrio parahaemolyticus]NVC29715.1 hypothetical protein [Vibrio parahaemolyticus]
MKEESVTEMAATLLDNPTWSDLEYYVVVILLVLILGSLLAFFKALYSEKAKYLAIQSSLDTIKLQTEVTAKTTETIKNDLEYKSWNRKEILQVRRTKLEEYVLLIMCLSDVLHKEMEKNFFGKDHSYDEQIWHKAQLIQKLYFPELEDEHNELRKSFADYKRWLGNGMTEVIAKRKNGNVNASVSEEHMAKYSSLLTSLNNSTLEIESKAREMSREFHT